MQSRYFTIFWIGALLAAIAAAQGNSPKGSSGSCGRSCLEGFVDQYLDALAAHNPKLLPLARNPSSLRMVKNWKLATAFGIPWLVRARIGCL